MAKCWILICQVHVVGRFFIDHHNGSFIVDVQWGRTFSQGVEFFKNITEIFGGLHVFTQMRPEKMADVFGLTSFLFLAPHKTYESS